MGFKEMLKDNFSTEKKITKERYRAAKSIFIFFSFFFFLVFYLVGAQFYENFFSNILGFLYILLLLSFSFFTFFFVRMTLLDKIPKHFFIIVFFFLLLFCIILMLPFIIEGGLLGILGLFRI